MLIGRAEEVKLLKSLKNEEESQFIAVFGRRRIGKTFLVRESFDYKFTFQHTGASNNDIEPRSQKQMQLDKFADSLRDAGYNCDTKLKSWNQAFNCLKELISQSRDKKKIIFIDELSWMDTKSSGLISALESFWNGWATARKEKDIVLIVCASATYWMINNIVNAKGGLHNRLTAQIYLKPFTLAECEQYLQSKNIVFNRHQIMQCYMILGGVPYYWSLLRKGKSPAQNIDELFFRENAELANEFDNLYAALFSSPDKYMKIVEALSSANRGLSRDEITAKTGIAGSGELTKELTELENCGFIRRYVPFGYKSRGCLYQLIDNYTLFYYRFLKDKAYDKNFWKNQMNSPKIRAWSGIAFEMTCLEHIDQIKAGLGIAGVQCTANVWSCKADPDAGVFGSQIDLLIVRRDQIINICEMKYSETEYTVDADFDRSMKRKLSDFQKKTGTKYALHPTLVTMYGLNKNSYSDEIQSLITAEDLFR